MDPMDSSNEIGSFEVTSKDLLGRIGKLRTKRGVLETPCLLPVVNPITQPLSLDPPALLDLGCKAIMANAYLLKRNFGKIVIEKGIHEFLGFDGIIFTDSGAYQILTYGRVDVEPLEIVRFEEDIGSDIAVILDIPTGISASRKKAEWTVNETLRRGSNALKNIRRKDILWVGPIQGGTHLDLIEFCAKKAGNKPFALYALGSPTKIMENYKFETLLGMVFAAKSNLPLNKPFHLFGAGHPFMFSIAVASGCDIFDSAAYVIYARNGRYFTDSGTEKVNDMNYFPCSCPVCIKHTPKDLQEMSEDESIGLLSKHNLHICLEEIKKIKEAIFEGRLWELIEVRTKSHPSLSKALYSLNRFEDLLEKNTPSTKKSGIFFFGHQSSSRPEIVGYRKRIIEKYKPPRDYTHILLVPAKRVGSLNRNQIFRKLVENVNQIKQLHICIYSVPYGLMPIEIIDMFPLSQTEIFDIIDEVTKYEAFKIVIKYVESNDYKKVILHADKKFWNRNKLNEIRDICKEKRIELILSYYGDGVWNKKAFERLQKVLEKLKKE